MMTVGTDSRSPADSANVEDLNAQSTGHNDKAAQRNDFQFGIVL